jgi:hypothetical protein
LASTEPSPAPPITKGKNMGDKKHLSIQITAEEQTRMRNLIPWGIISKVIRVLLLQTLDLVEQHGDIVLGALITGKLTALDLLKAGGGKVEPRRSKEEHY